MADTTLKKRIQARLDALGLSARAASLNAGLSTHYLRRVLSDAGTSITTENLLKLAEALETTPEWLLLGRSPDQGPPEAAELIEIYTQLDSGERSTLIDFARWQLSSKQEK